MRSVSIEEIDELEEQEAPLIELFGRDIKTGDYVLYGLDILHLIDENGEPLYQAPVYQVVDTDVIKKPVKHTDFFEYFKDNEAFNVVYKLHPSDEEHDLLNLKGNLNQYYGERLRSRVSNVDVFLRQAHKGDLVLFKFICSGFHLGIGRTEYGVLVADDEAFDGSEVISTYAYYIIKNPTKEEKRIKIRLLEQYQEFAEDDIKKRHVAGVGLNGRF